MRHHLSALLSVIALLCTSGASYAQTPEVVDTTADPYEGRIAVPDQSESTRQTALHAALAQVLQRLAGDALHADLDALGTDAAQLVQRYGYETDPQTRELLLVAGFDRHAVDAQLRRLDGSAAIPEAQVQLHLAGIDDARRYAEMLAVLRSAPGVTAVQVIAARGGELELQVRVKGGAAQLQEGLSLAPDWIAVAPPSGARLAYRMQP